LRRKCTEYRAAFSTAGFWLADTITTRTSGISSLDEAGRLEPVDAWHGVVEEKDVVGLLLEAPQRGLSALDARDVHRETACLQHLAHEPPRGLAVVDDHHARRLAHALHVAQDLAQLALLERLLQELVRIDGAQHVIGRVVGRVAHHHHEGVGAHPPGERDRARPAHVGHVEVDEGDIEGAPAQLLAGVGAGRGLDDLDPGHDR
jgi:hypothetical protein